VLHYTAQHLRRKTSSYSQNVKTSKACDEDELEVGQYLLEFYQPSRSSPKYYLKIQSVPERKQHITVTGIIY
jgi:hypothetical protein